MLDEDAGRQWTGGTELPALSDCHELACGDNE
jgi:hypothetical protein